MDVRMCQSCKTEFEPKKYNQRFCCPKCKSSFWNKETMQGITLSPDIREQLKSYADVHNISMGEMADKFLRQVMNPDRQTISDEFGNGNEIGKN